MKQLPTWQIEFRLWFLKHVFYFQVVFDCLYFLSFVPIRTFWILSKSVSTKVGNCLRFQLCHVFPFPKASGDVCVCEVSPIIKRRIKPRVPKTLSLPNRGKFQQCLTWTHIWSSTGHFGHMVRSRCGTADGRSRRGGGGQRRRVWWRLNYYVMDSE